MLRVCPICDIAECATHDPKRRQTMDLTIPPEALEAAARAVAEYYTSKEWSDINQGSKGVWRSAARAACIAMLEAWQTEKHKMIVGVAIDEVGGQCPAIILPLPQENTNAES